MNYREKQLDFEARAKKLTRFWYSKAGGVGQTYDDAHNEAKRDFQTLCNASKDKEGGWKKRVRLLVIAAKRAGHKL